MPQFSRLCVETALEKNKWVIKGALVNLQFVYFYQIKGGMEKLLYIWNAISIDKQITLNLFLS